MVKKFVVTMWLAVIMLSAGIAQASTETQAYLADLLAGNARFVAGTGLTNLAANADLTTRQTIAQAQHPFAIVLDCSDSRLTPEILFDQGLGQLFVVRVAGNVIAPHQIASIEYAVEHLGTKLIVILGHERCGAVSAAYGSFNANGSTTSTYNTLTKDLKNLVETIKPAVVDTKTASGSVTDCILNNTHKVTEALKTESEVISSILADPLKKDEIQIVEAFYDLDDGQIKVTNDDGVDQKIIYHTVNAKSVGNGTVTPSGDSAVIDGGKQTFYFTPARGESLLNIAIDGVSLGSTPSSYTVETVKNNINIVATFSSPPPPAVPGTIIYPNGGESLNAFDTCNISWNAKPGATQYILYYSATGAAPWAPIATVGAVTSYNWSVPNISTANARFRISAFNGSTWLGTDISDADTNIVATSIIPGAITSPNGGESYKALSHQTVTWNSMPGATQYILYYSATGAAPWTYVYTLGPVTSYDWTVPNIDSASVRFRISAFSGSTWLKTDTSDAVFTIAP
jgi:carbonic anhydrase